MSTLKRASLHVATIDGKETEKAFKPGDQFAAELIYFSDCILNDQEPEPSGWEGLADVRVINAIYELARTGRSVRIKPVPKKRRPDQKRRSSGRRSTNRG
jgi:predicted dehydrogenase